MIKFNCCLALPRRLPAFLAAVLAIPASLALAQTPPTAESPLLSPSFERVEQDAQEWISSGSWSTIDLQQASGGSYQRSDSHSDTSQLAFSGSWLMLGFIAGPSGGEVDVLIDGISQGTIDLYRREESPISVLFDGLSSAAHVVELIVLDTANSLSLGTRVQLDYADYGDGSTLPDGEYEQDDARVLTSDGWTEVVYSEASGESYIRNTDGTAWFPFAGESFSLHAIAYVNGGKAELFVDGAYLDTIDLFEEVFQTNAIPRSFSYEGLGAGPHVLQIVTYENTTTIDKLETPGAAPFIDPDPPVSGVTRFEADHRSIRYNGLPLTHAATTWTRTANVLANHASSGEYVDSASPGDSISLDFDNEWLGIGFATNRFGGQAEIAIDGQVVETVDLYSRFDDTRSVYLRELGTGAHTVAVTVLDAAHPNSDGNRILFDYFDVWDGQALTDGTFEEDDERIVYSGGWDRTENVEASAGAYASSGVNTNATLWFPFTAESVTWQGWTRFNYQDVEIRLNGARIGLFDLYSYDEETRSYSFDDLGPGPHVLELRRYRSSIATLDAFTTPSTDPGFQPPESAAIVRHEEDHPAFRYDGEPYSTMSRHWKEQRTGPTSGGYNLSNSRKGDRWSLDFDGQWLNIGFRSSETSGSVEIVLDGISQGVHDTFGGINDVKNISFGGLKPGPHSVEVIVVNGPVLPDYMDVWNGQTIDEGWYDARLENETTQLFQFSNKTAWRRTDDVYARDGRFLNGSTNADPNLWFTFTGSDLTLLGYQNEGTSLHVVIDGTDYGLFDMDPPSPLREQPLALHFPDLGDGAHVAQVFVSGAGGQSSRIDAFEVNPETFTSYTPQVKWFDTTAQESLPETTGTGFATTVAAGDLNGDGMVSLVAPSTNGRLYVYRGDGQDAGGGSPIQWTSDLVGPAGEPALADLDGDGDAEIVVSGRDGTYAFHHDGQLLWSNPDVASYFAGENLGWGGPSIGNIDLTPEPEIVIAALGDALYVLDHEGNMLFSDPLSQDGDFPTVPVLADITGDGVLDIVVAEEWTLRVIDHFNGGTVAWSRDLPDPIVVLGGAGTFGAPAVADLDGDSRPEIIINWGHVIEAIQDDGSLLWRYETDQTDLFRPSAVTVADVTGDGQVNLITASAVRSGFFISNHQLMVLDAAGELVWQADVADDTASASGVAAQDLTGNEAWEIMWNGSVDGFLIFNGPDGKRLYNEPYTGSGTVLDYPTLADVDGDAEAEVIVAGANGLFVIEHDDRWVDSRPVWNQHHYHINNISNDWSIPFTEENSWQTHNTYRTQTPDRDPDCVIDDGQPVAPEIVDVSPQSGDVLPSGTPLVITGRALQVGFSQPLIDVRIDGQSVDVLDPSGSFFKSIELEAGPNVIEIHASDRCANSTASLTLTGSGDDENPWTGLADASVLLEARFSATTHDPSSDRLLSRVQAFNAGPSVPGPVLMAIGGDADPSIGLLNADGFTPQGEPYVIIVPADEVLDADSVSAARDLALANPRRAPIDFTPRWIAPVNQPPYFSSIPDTRAFLAQSWRYTAEVGDANGDPWTLSLPVAPADMTVVDDELSWTPSAVGRYDIVIEADDGRGGTARQGFTLEVEDTDFNRPPVFSSTPPVQIPTGGAYAYAAVATDLDGDPLTFSLPAAPAGVLINAGTGAVTWPHAEPGQHSMVLTADDGRGGQVSQAWTLYVGEIAATQPGPAFASVPIGFAAVGVQYRYAFRVNSVDAAAPTVSLVQGPEGMHLDVDEQVLTWVPGGGDLGPHAVELLATDSSGLEALQRFDLEVLPELPNQPPYFVSSPALNARSGSPYTYDAEAIDPEFEALTWALETAPDGMTIDPSSGLVNWTPSTATPADVMVTLRATDPAGGVAEQQFTIRLRESNVVPVITTTPDTSALVGEFYSVRMLADDADGDALTWRLLQGPEGMTLHSGLGWLHWTTTGVAPNSYAVTVEVSDDWGGRDELDYTVDLTADDQPPEVSVTTLQNPICEAEPVTVCVEASDNVGLSEVSLDIDGQSRALDASRCHLWTPPDAGQFVALGEAMDPGGQITQDETTLTVADCNDEQAPVVTLISPLSAVAFDQPEPIVVTIEDNTPEVLTWEVTIHTLDAQQSRLLASGSGPVSEAEVAVFDPTSLQAGDYEVEVLASDGAQTGGIRFVMAAGTGEKPGRIAFTTADLTWQLGALPLTIGRSYDSLDAGPLGLDSGDFGPGWRVALSASVEDTATDLPPDTSGIDVLAGEPFTTQTRVTVVKPNGERVGFRFDPQGKSYPAVLQFEVNYQPDPGVTDTLRAVDWPETVFQLGAGFADYLIPYNPTVYELETVDGVVFVISEEDGLLEVRDAQGGVVTASDSGWQSSWGARVDYQRDELGRISDIVLIDDDGTTEIGRIVYGYDANGNLASVTDLAGGVSTFEYADPDLPHHLTAMFDALGRPIARMVFDDEGRQIAHCPGGADPDTLVGCSLFDFGSDVSSQTIFDGRGFRSELFFDERGLMVLRRDEIEVDTWVEESWEYDDAGRETEHIDRDGGVTTSEWDEDGNLVARTEPDGRRWEWTWGECVGEDEWLSRCDMLGNCNRQTFDSECRLVQSIDPLGGETAYEYDALGQRSARIDPVGQRIETEFDQRGKMVRFTDALGASMINTFGDLGEQLSEIERDGRRRDWTYDEGARVETETWSGKGASDIGWSHDEANFVDQLSWQGSSVDLSYGANGKVERITHSSQSAPDWWIEYSYDANDNVTRLEDSFGGLTEYDYNGLNQLIEIRQSGAGVVPKRVVIDNSNTGQPLALQRYASLDDSLPGPTSEFEYGCLSCPTTLSRIVHRHPDSSVIRDLVYERNAIHQITGLTDTDGTHAFVHDGRGWLIQADHPGGFAASDEAFVWDDAGNWLSRSGDFGGATAATLGYQNGQGGHRLLDDGVNSYVYDARGSAVEKSGPSGRIEIERDARGNAITITEYDSTDAVISTASYIYSSSQQRMRAERDGVVRHYVFDGPNPIIALDENGQVVWRQLHVRGPDRPLAMELRGEIIWLLSDHIGSVRDQVDTAGQVLASFSYDAFGRQLSGPAPTIDDPVRFTGREFDLPGELGYYRLRLYDPTIGRFLSTDMLEPWHYRYADNNPVNYVDPDGALTAIEFGLLICDIAAAISTANAAITSIDAAFSGDVKALLAALAGQLFGTVVPCGIPTSSG